MEHIILFLSRGAYDGLKYSNTRVAENEKLLILFTLIRFHQNSKIYFVFHESILKCI